MNNLTKKEQELFDRYQYLMRYDNQIDNAIDDMYKRGASIEEINNFLTTQKENIKPSDIFDFIRGMRYLTRHVDFNLSDKLLKQYIINHYSDFFVADLYNKIFQASDPIFGKEVEGWISLNNINRSNVETALFILFALESQEKVEQKVLEEHKTKTIHRNAIYRIARAYLSMNEVHNFDLPNYDFLYELIKELFVSFPSIPYKDEKDMILALFKHVYTMPPPGFSGDIFKDKVINKIESIDKNVWKDMLHLSSAEVIKLIKSQYQYEPEFDLWHWEYDKNTIEPLHKIFTIINLRGNRNKEIEAFFEEHPISPIAWVRAANAGLVVIPDEEGDGKIKYIDSFIEEHLNEFSYDDLLERIINCHVSERATSLELRVMDKLKNLEQINSDIKNKYQEGKVSPESWDYLLYIRPSLRKF